MALYPSIRVDKVRGVAWGKALFTRAVDLVHNVMNPSAALHVMHDVMHVMSAYLARGRPHHPLGWGRPHHPLGWGRPHHPVGWGGPHCPLGWGRPTNP